jgi:heme-degrading monooxygenase HmoA
MMRRTYLKSVLGGAALAAAQAAPDEHAIELHVDLAVDPAREREMLDVFHKTFRPAASQQPGFIDAKMLKLRAATRGVAPPGANYRFVLLFATEEQRRAWVATPVHQKTWPLIAGTLTNPNFTALFYDLA